jgi:hypothetical protein
MFLYKKKNIFLQAEVESHLIAGFCPGEAGPPANCSCPLDERSIPWPGKEL